jgi:hypothetical protein
MQMVKHMSTLATPGDRMMTPDNLARGFPAVTVECSLAGVAVLAAWSTSALQQSPLPGFITFTHSHTPSTFVAPPPPSPPPPPPSTHILSPIHAQQSPSDCHVSDQTVSRPAKVRAPSHYEQQPATCCGCLFRKRPTATLCDRISSCPSSQCAATRSSWPAPPSSPSAPAGGSHAPCL